MIITFSFSLRSRRFSEAAGARESPDVVAAASVNPHSLRRHELHPQMPPQRLHPYQLHRNQLPNPLRPPHYLHYPRHLHRRCRYHLLHPLHHHRHHLRHHPRQRHPHHPYPPALATAAPPTRSRCRTDLPSMKEVNSSSRGNRGHKKGGGTPLKKGGERVAIGGGNSASTGLSLEETSLM
ncbi:unnamed protein product [Closterium sp. NIES-54]